MVLKAIQINTEDNSYDSELNDFRDYYRANIHPVLKTDYGTVYV